MNSSFADRLAAAIRSRRTPAVVGLDPVLQSLPGVLRPRDNTLAAAVAAVDAFCRGVIDVVAPLVPAVKINAGFFERSTAKDWQRISAWWRTRSARTARHWRYQARRHRIDRPALLRGHLDRPAFADVPADCIPDAVTLAGYLGANAVRPFIDVARAQGKGVYVLVRPSDPGADEVHDFGGGEPFYRHMARLVQRWGDDAGLIGECGLSCVGAVVAPKDAESTAALRALLPRTPFLVPGYGAQGGSAESCRPCFRADGSGAIVNASRSVIYAFSKGEQKKAPRRDWQTSVEDACRAFAADIGRLFPPAGP